MCACQPRIESRTHTLHTPTRDSQNARAFVRRDDYAELHDHETKRCPGVALMLS
jgi:hypothetical protein